MAKIEIEGDPRVLELISNYALYEKDELAFSAEVNFCLTTRESEDLVEKIIVRDVG